MLRRVRDTHSWRHRDILHPGCPPPSAIAGRMDEEGPRRTSVGDLLAWFILTFLETGALISKVMTILTVAVVAFVLAHEWLAGEYAAGFWSESFPDGVPWSAFSVLSVCLVWVTIPNRRPWAAWQRFLHFALLAAGVFCAAMWLVSGR